MLEAFALTPAPEAAPTADKPAWWRAAVERATLDHRRARAAALRVRALERANEAQWIRHAILEGQRSELSSWPLEPEPLRELAQGPLLWSPWPRWSGPESSWVTSAIARWDSERSASSGGRRRLLRGEWEKLEYWRGRVLVEADRRIESKWHAHRAAGQLDRFRRAERCGTVPKGVITCTACSTPRGGVVAELCDALLLCPRCRARRVKRYRAQIIRSRKAALDRARRARAHRGRDPLGERFLTLTAPHLPIELGGPERQARIVRDAWRPFMNALRDHWRGRPGFALTRFLRVVEATEGAGEEGHTHIHAWILSPFVRDSVVAALWARALIRSGFPAKLWPLWREKPELLKYLAARSDHRAHRWAKHVLPKVFPYAVVHLERVRGSAAELAAELCKYLTKDIVADPRGGLRPIHPAVMAALYRGLDGARLITAARGFWVLVRPCCDACGSVGTLRPVGGAGFSESAQARAPPEGFTWNMATS